MKIVITLAGHSRRFRASGYSEPKAFISIGDAPMISHVVDMFDAEDEFWFVMNEQQLVEYPNALQVLKGLAKRSHVTVIPAHEKGPVYSALQVKEIRDDDEVIVSYCDFLVDWSYTDFLRHAKQHDGAVPVFCGFQPASLGDTLFAYIRADGDRFLELREKSSFTNNRMNEPASVGIYYFRQWSKFKQYGQEILDHNNVLPEAYVSLLYNLMVRDGLEVVIHEVDRFICWGTPRDLEQYLYWQDYHKEIKKHEIKIENASQYNHATVNLIPMAGGGQRFRASGYLVPKPLIQVSNHTMVASATKTFPPSQHWIFAAQAEFLERYDIARAINCESEFTIVPIKGLTSGQAATCLQARTYIPEDASLFIASCDYQTLFNLDAWWEKIADPSIDAIIWSFRFKSQLIKDPRAFAYCRIDTDGETVTEVVEKACISDRPELDPMVVGTFWFRHSSDFWWAAENMMKRENKINGEYYVGTSMNELIRRGARIVHFPVEKWISFGDPLELKVFEFWYDHFHARRGEELLGKGSLEFPT